MLMTDKKLMLGTTSKTKISAWNELFILNNRKDVFVLSPAEMDIEPLDIQERDDAQATYYDNALIKAKAYFDKYGMAVLADDSGLEIEHLDGWPGICTARCNGGERGSISEFIVEKMKGVEDYADRKCTYHTAAVFIDSYGHIFYCNLSRDGYVSKKVAGEGNCVETIFIPRKPFFPPEDGNELSTATLGQIAYHRRCGQHLQTSIMYPVLRDLPRISFMNLLALMCDDNAVKNTTEKTLTAIDFEKEYADIVDYVTISRLPTDIIYKFEMPKNPQLMTECMMGIE